MKKLVCIILLLCCFNCSFAHHIKGGWIGYEYLGDGVAANSSRYKITVYLYVSCTTSGPTSQVILGVFDAGTNASVTSQTILNTSEYGLSKTTFSSCLNNPPSVCYRIFTYVTTIELANNANGYSLTVQDALRVDGLINISNSGSSGITLTSAIPGTINGVDYHTNTSPLFVFQDTAIICHSSVFSIPFSGKDADGDSLSYAFGNGLNVTGAGMGTSTNAPAAPPYPSLSYTSGYNGLQPLGSLVTINPATGVISGTAPATTGEYDVAVYVKEWRKGVLLDSIKKELQIQVADCSLSAAILEPSYLNCDSFAFSFENESTSANITSYYWDFGVTTSTSDTSTQPKPTYTYADTGTYQLKLKVSSSLGCTDSATTMLKVYPGFTPAFNVTGSCYQSPFNFTDASYVKYGSISTWSWNFGDASSTDNTSVLQNPTHQYSAAGNVTASLTVTSSKGCNGTVTKPVVVNDKPDIYLPFTDTLICSNDSLPLIVQSSSATTFSWSPNYNINNTNTSNPVVYPNDTTVYTVLVKDKGCVDSATVTVNVLDFITVTLNPDTAMCLTDTIQLRPVSYALSYTWSESGGANTLSNNTAKYPLAKPLETTTYYVTANLGHCQDTAHETVYVSPYPTATVSAGTAICTGSTTQLSASTNAANFAWSPAGTLLHANTLNPIAGPSATTDYLFTVTDSFYCPKPVTDTITVKVIEPVLVNAGNDTSIVLNQPLQLTATGNFDSLNYVWSPVNGLDNAFIHNPVLTINSAAVDSVIYKVTATTAEGCYGSDYITVKIFNTGPEIFIPTAFTPNGDGKNDVVIPVLVGIKQYDFFKVYNRWGQLLFTTSQAGKGWDGTISGTQQPSGTYVFMAQGKDYNGKNIFKKGTIVLIR